MDDEARYTPLAPDRRRFIRPLVILLVVLLIAAAGLGSAYAWTRTQYFVGVSGDQVAIYQGLSDGVPGVRLSRVFEVQPLAVADLPPYYQDQVRGNIDAPEPADRPRDDRRTDGGRQALRRAEAAEGVADSDADREAHQHPHAQPAPTPTPTSTSVGPGELDC